MNNNYSIKPIIIIIGFIFLLVLFSCKPRYKLSDCQIELRLQLDEIVKLNKKVKQQEKIIDSLKNK